MAEGDVRRLRRAVTRRGVGVHGGRPAAVTLRPAPWGSGRVLVVDGARAPVHVRNATAPGGCTVLRVGAATVATAEHLLAALVGRGVTDVAIAVEGPEVPILDGSAAPWCAAIDDAGTEEGPGHAPLVVTRAIEVRAAGGVATVAPHDGCRVSVEVAFPGLAGAFTVDLPGGFDAVAAARTFVLPADVPRLRAAGRGRGATPANTVVWGRTTDLRFPDEPVRHKLLDAIGDLALLGRPLRGHLHVVRGSHALHQAVVAALLEDR